MENYQAKGSQQMTSVNTSNKAEVMQSESLKPQSYLSVSEHFKKIQKYSREELAEFSRKARLAGKKTLSLP
jgi:hypothetical protein